MNSEINRGQIVAIFLPPTQYDQIRRNVDESHSNLETRTGLVAQTAIRAISEKREGDTPVSFASSASRVRSGAIRDSVLLPRSAINGYGRTAS